MDTKTTLPWVTEGASVAMYSTNGFTPMAVLTKIERITATQVICANGLRFHRRFHRFKLRTHYGSADQPGLQQIGSPYGSELLPADDPRVRTVLAQGECREFVHQAEKIFKGRPDKGNVDAMLATLDQIVTLANAAKAKIVAYAGVCEVCGKNRGTLMVDPYRKEVDPECAQHRADDV